LGIGRAGLIAYEKNRGSELQRLIVVAAIIFYLMSTNRIHRLGRKISSILTI